MTKTLAALCIATVYICASPAVSTTIAPTKYFIQKIAGDTINVNVMLPQGADPHTYEPKPKQMKNLQKSELYFTIGVEFDDIYLPRFVSINPNLKVIDTQDGIKFLSQNCQHDDTINSHHHQNDPHIWLDPILVKTQAQNIKNGLINTYKTNSEIYEQNYAAFLDEISLIDSYAKERLNGLKGSKFIINHPSFGYFSERYNLIQIPIEIDGKEPKPSDLKRLMDEAKQSDVGAIFCIKSSPCALAKSIAKELGVKVAFLDDLPLDWAKSMRENIDIFAKNLKANPIKNTPQISPDPTKTQDDSLQISSTPQEQSQNRLKSKN